MFIAWRCLYAAIVGSRVDNRPLNLDYAYKRTLQLCITRLKAYGEKWHLWCRKNMYTELKCIIPVDKRDRTVITQDMLGEYTVDEAFFKEFERVRQVAAPPAQRPQNARQARGPPTRPQHQRMQHQIIPFQGVGNATQTTLTQFFTRAQ